jgi:hypothetical protein
MPVTSRTFIKASIVYLALGAVLGALMLINRWIPLGPVASYMRASHIELLVIGWLTQLILGVAWWLFPPLKIGLRTDAPLPVRRGQSQRGSEPLFWATFACLNAGVLLGAVFAPLHSWSRVEALGTLADLADLFLLLAALGFVANMWARVRELGG